MNEEVLRIKKLLEHWIEHNEEHLARFREVAAVAEKLGITEVSRAIQTAAMNGNEVSRYLKKALNSIE